MVKIAINGLGRIGRCVLKLCLGKNVEVIAVNDLCDLKTIVYLLKYDSVYGTFKGKIEAGKDFIKINGKSIKVFSEKEPEKLPWKTLGIDVVVESTGFFEEEAEKHIKAGAKKVIISAPSKKCDATIVLGVNEEKLKKEYKIISM
jgi:glyceraldehyde 3-phosphate dehydrogenase